MKFATANDLGNAIRFRRHILKLTQAELADATGLSDVYISLIEQGKRIPNDRALCKIARELDLIPLDLLVIKYQADPKVDTEIKMIMKEIQDERRGTPNNRD